MIITIISFLLTFLLIILVEIDCHKRRNSWHAGEARAFYILLFIIFVPICVVAILQLRINRDYEIRYFEREMLIQAYEDGNEYIYPSIVEFNKKLEKEKRYKDNLFVNWFINDRIADEIDYIGIDS